MGRRRVKVALKILLGDGGGSEYSDTAKEVNLMAELKHNNVVRLIGISGKHTAFINEILRMIPNPVFTATPLTKSLESESLDAIPVPGIILELMQHGDLLDFLVRRKDANLPLSQVKPGLKCLAIYVLQNLI